MSEAAILQLDRVPVYQNKMFDTAAEALACPLGNILLAQDSTSGLVCNVTFDPSKLEYDSTYQNEQGHSSIFQTHLSHVLETIDRHFGSRTILEVGCGKGAFLDQLRLAGHDAWGVDPAYQGDAPYIIKAHFNPELGIRRDAIVMRHVLEHIPQPIDFLNKVAASNGSQGLVYVEVPCLDWILRKRAWFDIFYEHVNYFRLTDFDRMFGTVLESGHLFGGQYLYAVAELASLRQPEELGSFERLTIPESFFSSLTRSSTLIKPGSRPLVWGAAAKGVMFAHHMLRLGLSIDAAIDINPAKQGKFLAASAVPVLSPRVALTADRRGADIFVMNSNYLAEIRAMSSPDFNFITVDDS